MINDNERVVLNVDLDGLADVRLVVLDFSSVNFVDLVGIKALRRVGICNTHFSMNISTNILA